MTKLMALGVGFLFFGPAVAHAGGEGRPNVLIVMADQWRAQAFGFAGDPNVKTPHLDALERSCVDFTNAIASVPVCCPTRASLWTGQRALTHGVFMNDVPLSPDAVSLAKVLRAQGYDTGYIGKWHLNGDGRSAFIPRERRQGFEYWKVLECTHRYNRSYYYGDTPEKLEWQGYDAIAQTKDAEGYLRSRATNSAPFLLVVSWGPPHSPYDTAPPEYRALYDPAKIILRGNVPEKSAAAARRDLAGYYAHCSALDDCAGRLLQTLRETGLGDNTIVVFTSDHGDMLGSHGFSAKQKPFDESIRVPLLFRCPPRMRIEPRRVNAIIASEDFMPTLLGLCNIAIPPTVQGADYSGYLRGGKNPSGNIGLISCVAPFGEWNRGRGGREFRGIRTGRFTYVRGLDGPWLLYDDASDPLQLTNLVNQPPAARWQADLEQKLGEKLRQTHDAFLPGGDYLKRWHYTVDASGTVPFEN